ncbi:uncharacterized protein LOC114949050 [Acropora millepora]|uniref:uncharacterized protein LOC114949050 n=1 Tax=Acropora millepora TaxID=45264 RepID=UPI001CF3526E|nr:uncharacterized protein LOC114949050 [Acropora millepora]XP_044176895.1 uncharacterized protein LOC114949050 [Acropora millepora]XP_044176896.1 uncharacterized protein LOC114949050 [Acropora millepora]
MEEKATGLAFSGGGIRSAALCSGVLRRLLRRGVHVDYVSCVSGGNYTAAAYLDWKYRHGKEDDDGWHKQFFEHMRKRVGYLCDWQRHGGLQGVLDTIIMVALLITINLVIPCVMYSAGAFTAAVIVDMALGDILRESVECEEWNATNSARGNSCIPSCVQFNMTHPKVTDQSILFASLAIIFCICYVAKKVFFTHKIHTFFRLGQIISAFTFAFTFIPWLIHQFSNVLPKWLKISVFVLSIFFWLGFPPLRKKASFAIVTYLYAFVITWRVYKCSTSFLREYTHQSFNELLLISSCLIWMSPYLGIFSVISTFIYYKWRLQKALFTRQSVGSHGCGGISCKDFFPIFSCFPCCRTTHDPNTNPLKMSDLQDVTPLYVSNVAADYWRLNSPSQSAPPFAVMSISPHEIQRIDANQRIDQSGHTVNLAISPDEDQLIDQPGHTGNLSSSPDSTSPIDCQPEHKLHLSPNNVSQVDAMVTSAAVIAISPEQNEPYRDLQIMLGLILRKGFKPTPHQESSSCWRSLSWLLALLIQSIAAFPVMFIAVVALVHWDTNVAKELYVWVVTVVYFLFFLGIAVMPTGSLPPPCYDRFVRWCHIHLYHVRFLREVLKVKNIGPNPPAILSLSDGARLEKYGLLYLLKKRLKKILIVDGSFIAQEAGYSENILKSMDQARALLHCEFLSFDGRDVKEQMRKEYVEAPKGRGKPRHFRFLVQYFNKEHDGSYSMASAGEVMIIAPRHPSMGVAPPDGMGTTWADYGENLDPNVWGPGPFLSADEVDRLTFCCCECCHTSFGCVSQISKMLCLGFPSTSTLNQFFTPSLFTAYHREGYRACAESNAEEFLYVHDQAGGQANNIVSFQTVA